MDTAFVAPLTSQWEDQLRRTYGRLSLRQIAAEIMALEAEKANPSNSYNAVVGISVVAIVDGRLRLALDELRSRIADGRA